MAMKWNWRRLSFGSGAVLAAISTAYAFNHIVAEKHDEKYAITKNATWSHQKLFPFPVAHTKSSGVVSQALGQDRELLLDEAIRKSRILCTRIKNEKGLPGLTVGVSVNGKLVWQEGFGLSNLENEVAMKPEAVMRIASISKSMTMAMLAKLMEEGKIDIDKPIQTYLPKYPEKYFEGEKVTITTRHLLSHISGIRHYKRKVDKDGKDDSKENQNTSDSKISTRKKNDDKDKSKDKNKQNESEFDAEEYYLQKKFKSVEESLKLFQDDELFNKPGTKYLYTTHGWTVVSAIIEKLTETDFPKYCERMFDFWGLENTTMDLHEPIIRNRVSYYTRLENGRITNSPYVDNSYKWAGGGFLSNVSDLTQFANILLYSLQAPENTTTCEKGLPIVPFLKQSTVNTMWTGNPVTQRPDSSDFLYALGFVVGEPLRKCMFCKERDLKVVEHTGGAIGASSVVLLAFPTIKSASSSCDSSKSPSANKEEEEPKVRGVVVAMITNMTSVGLKKNAQDIANHFKELI